VQPSAYYGVMPRKPNDKHFEADVSPDLWDAAARVNAARGRLSKRQFAEAMFRMWTTVPEWLRLLALFGSEGEALIRDAFAGLKLTVTAVPPSEAELARMAKEDADAVLGEAEAPAGRGEAAAAKAG
jgi:hypothetical protein